MVKIMSFAGLILALSIVINSYIMMNAAFSLGLFSLAFTALVFGTSLFWLIRLPDTSVHFARPWLSIPAVLMGVAVYSMLSKHADQIVLTRVALEAQGHSMLSRNQAMLVITRLLLALALVIASLVLRRRK